MEGGEEGGGEGVVLVRENSWEFCGDMKSKDWGWCGSRVLKDVEVGGVEEERSAGLVTKESGSVEELMWEEGSGIEALEGGDREV